MSTSIQPIMDPILKKWRSLQNLSEEEMIWLMLDLMLKRDMRPEGWFNLRYQPRSIEEKIDKILIIAMAAIGDVICTTPAILGLKDRFKGSSIYILVEDGPSQAVTENSIVSSIVDEVIIFPRGLYLSKIEDGEREFSEVAEELEMFIRDLQVKRFNLVINLHITSWSAFLSYLNKAEYIFGLTVDEKGASLVSGNLWMLYAYYIYWNPAMKRINKFDIPELFIRMAGIQPKERILEFFWDTEDVKRGRDLRSFGVKRDDLLIGLCPGGTSWRRWQPERFANLGDLLSQCYGAKILLFGSQGEIDLTDQIASMMKCNPVNLAGSSLKELAEDLKICGCLITNDTGPMHLAAAVGTPVIVISGPTWRQPYGSGGHIILQADLSCIGCGDAQVCEERKCFELISEEAVLEAFKFQRGELMKPPQISGVKFYYSDRELPQRLFLYTLLNKEKIDSQKLAEEILAIASLNLWIEENNRLDFFEEPISPGEIEDVLAKHYEIANFGEGIRVCISSLREYEAICEEGIRLLEKIYPRFYSGQRELAATLVERFNQIERRMDERVGKYLRFLYFLFLKNSHDEIGWRLNLYRATQEACRYLQKSLNGLEKK